MFDRKAQIAAACLFSFALGGGANEAFERLYQGHSGMSKRESECSHAHALDLSLEALATSVSLSAEWSALSLEYERVAVLDGQIPDPATSPTWERILVKSHILDGQMVAIGDALAGLDFPPGPDKSAERSVPPPQTKL